MHPFYTPGQDLQKSLLYQSQTLPVTVHATGGEVVLRYPHNAT